jgi:hypothetical protein
MAESLLSVWRLRQLEIEMGQQKPARRKTAAAPSSQTEMKKVTPARILH